MPKADPRAAAAAPGEPIELRARAGHAARARSQATCSSTSRATHTPSTTGSTTCSASWTSKVEFTGYLVVRPRRSAERLTLAGEKRAFERLIDFIVERHARHPNMHVYHYAPYEPTALKRLMGRHGTREEEVDRLLRGGVLVDLFRAVRQGLRASVESYSIKRIEALYDFQRSRACAMRARASSSSRRGSSSGTVSDRLRTSSTAIEAYNRDDVAEHAAPARLARASAARPRGPVGTGGPAPGAALAGRSRAAAGGRCARRARRRTADRWRPPGPGASQAGAARPLAPRPAAVLAPARGEGRVLGLLQSDGHGSARAQRGQGGARPARARSAQSASPSSRRHGRSSSASAGAIGSRRRTTTSARGRSSTTRGSTDPRRMPSGAPGRYPRRTWSSTMRARPSSSTCPPPTTRCTPRPWCPMNIYGDKEQRAALLRIGEWVVANGIDAPGTVSAPLAISAARTPGCDRPGAAATAPRRG